MATASASPAPAEAGREVSILDVIELDAGYTTVVDNYYRAVRPQALLDGARNGIVAYLRGAGIPDPIVPLLRARSDGRGVVPAIERQLGLAVNRYGDRVSSRAFVYSVIRGELGALHDPYSVFFTKAELGRFTQFLDGTAFGGIGVVVALDTDNRFRADAVFAGSPADRAGIVAGDWIVSVDGRSLSGLDARAITALLRGAPGTVVRIGVRSAAATAPREIAVTRALVTPPDVTARLLAGDVAYIALRGFGPTAGQQVHAALQRLRAQGARATVFDLRGNGGGYEDAAVRVASAFVPSGTILITQANHGHRVRTRADGSAPIPQPLAVLVDGDSASGSELVTGAIRDHGLGTVVGSRTFGKGLVQAMFPLPDGSALKLTTARYYTPAGHDIDRVGIVPDIVVVQPAGAAPGLPGRDPQLDAALKVLAAPRTAPVPSTPNPASSTPPLRAGSARYR